MALTGATVPQSRAFLSVESSTEAAGNGDGA